VATTQSSQRELTRKDLKAGKKQRRKLQSTWVTPLSFKIYTNFFPCQFLDDVQIAKTVPQDRYSLNINRSNDS